MLPKKLQLGKKRKKVEESPASPLSLASTGPPRKITVITSPKRSRLGRVSKKVKQSKRRDDEDDATVTSKSSSSSSANEDDDFVPKRKAAAAGRKTASKKGAATKKSVPTKKTAPVKKKAAPSNKTAAKPGATKATRAKKKAAAAFDDSVYQVKLPRREVASPGSTATNQSAVVTTSDWRVRGAMDY
jgi:hypothetical protein